MKILLVNQHNIYNFGALIYKGLKEARLHRDIEVIWIDPRFDLFADKMKQGQDITLILQGHGFTKEILQLFDGQKILWYSEVLLPDRIDDLKRTIDCYNRIFIHEESEDYKNNFSKITTKFEYLPSIAYDPTIFFKQDLPKTITVLSNGVQTNRRQMFMNALRSYIPITSCVEYNHTILNRYFNHSQVILNINPYDDKGIQTRLVEGGATGVPIVSEETSMVLFPNIAYFDYNDITGCVQKLTEVLDKEQEYTQKAELHRTDCEQFTYTKCVERLLSKLT